MNYSTFNPGKTNYLERHMFFDGDVSVARFDEQTYPIFEKLTEKQLGFFWRPEEVSLEKDRRDFDQLTSAEQHVFVSNLKYQTLLDSVQGRSPNIAFLPIASIPELENWIETWSFSETIHSRSYTHIIRNVFADPSEVLNDISVNKEIQKRALAVTEHYDKLIKKVAVAIGEDIDLNNDTDFRLSVKKDLYLTMISVNVLEAIRFYVSFACSFSFAERELMEGNAKIIKLIARDEALHLSGTQYIINQWHKNNDDPEMHEIAESCKEDAINVFRQAVNQEKEWAEYLFKNGSIIGLNANILHKYVEYITNVRLKAIGFDPIFDSIDNPLPWMNHWLTSSNVQVAPQETEISSYLTGQVKSDVKKEAFKGFTL